MESSLNPNAQLFIPSSKKLLKCVFCHKMVIDEKYIHPMLYRCPECKHTTKEGKILTGVEDMDILILLNLSEATLKTVCIINKYTSSLSDNVWKRKVELKYGEKVTTVKDESMTYLEQYYSLYGFLTDLQNPNPSKSTVNDLQNPRLRTKTRKLLILGENEYFAAKTGRLDMFIAYSHIKHMKITKKLIRGNLLLERKLYQYILNEIMQNNGREYITTSQFQFSLLSIMTFVLSRRNDIEMIDLIYKQCLKGNKILLMDSICRTVLKAEPNENILTWLVNHISESVIKTFLEGDEVLNNKFVEIVEDLGREDLVSLLKEYGYIYDGWR